MGETQRERTAPREPAQILKNSTKFKTRILRCYVKCSVRLLPYWRIRCTAVKKFSTAVRVPILSGRVYSTAP